jgi:CDP-diglyceride synthetase
MVGHLKSIMRNVYNGLIWFGVLIMLMVSNDSFAWLFRVSCFVFRVGES